LLIYGVFSLLENDNNIGLLSFLYKKGLVTKKSNASATIRL